MRTMKCFLLVVLSAVAVSAAAAVYSPKPSEPFYQQAARSHTGIPSIAVSPRNGRLWLTCYCAWKGGECAYNYVPLMTSADGGRTWKDVLVVDPDGEGPLRAFDPELFVNSAGKLVWSWTERACNPENPLDGCFADPKGDRLMFVEIDAENEPAAPYPEARFACRGVMMCKPIRLADGRTLLPLSHWFDEPSACFYATTDWRTFDFLGGAKLPKEIRQFDEHSVIQCADGSLKAWIRTDHEPRESVSTDGGRTWSEPVVSQVGNPNSRLYCTKLRNGHLLMVKHGKMGEHFEQKGWLPRRELRAFVSDDEGRTWKGDLLLDERTKGLSYPDGDVAADGSVYLTYDCDRMRAGEILVAHITEQDVLAGKLVSEGSYLRRVASSRTIHRPETASGMEVLPLGAIRPEGWLRTQVELQRDGLTGHAEELYDDIGKSAWLGVKGGDGWERGPYYAKGLVALGLTLGDAALTAKARKWIDAIIGSQRENGDFGPRNDNWWANMPALCAVRDWGAATGDVRVVPFLRRYFRHQFDRLREHPLMSDSFWAAARAGDNMEVALWLERKTGEEWLTALADLLATQSADWETYYRRGGDGGGQFGFRQHIVNFMQGLKEPALAWSIGHAGSAGIKAYSAAFDPNGWAVRQHGRVDRMLNGTELLSGREACQGTELCATAERILSCQSVLATCGWFGAGLAEADDLESVAYNTLPSTLADDGRGVRYYHLLNMPRCSASTKLGFENNGDGGAVVPGPDAGFGCCRSNFHFAWPKFVQSMWMKGGFHMGGGLVALAYGPCTVSNELATIVEGGTYPFGDTVTMKFVRTNGKAWPFTPRRPRWCADKDMVVKLNGEVVPRDRHGQIVRTWAAGDELEITFGAKVSVEQGAGGALAVRRGALVYALKIDAEVKPLGTKPGREGYSAREYAPKSPWNYALVSDGKSLAAEYVAPTDLSGNVFAHGCAPSALKVKAYRTDCAGWGTFRADGHFNGRAQEPPPSPIEKSVLTGGPEEITLVPLGSTQIRITLFPWLTTD